MRISVTHAWLQVVFTTKKSSAGTFDIKIGDESFSAIDLKDVGSLRAIVDDVTEAMRKLVLAAEFNELTGFDPNAPAKDAKPA